MPVNRSDAEILGAHADRIKNDIRKCEPGTVTAVNASRQTVDVQLATNNLLHDAVGNAFSEPATSIADVPLGTLRGGGFLVWLPVAVGDSVLVVYSDQSSDTWRSGDGSPQDPGFHGKHSRDSAFAIPMWAPDAKMMTSPAAGKVIIGKDNADEQIAIGASDIELGRGATDFVGLASKIDSAVSTIVAAFNGHTHQVAAFGSPGGPPLQISPPGPGTITPPPPSVAATLVKAK